MSALLFLFEHKIAHMLRWALLATGYDARRRDMVETLYGIYVILLLGGWGLAMLSWAVVTLTDFFVKAHAASSHLDTPIFFGLAFWLALTPWIAQRSYNLYRFSTPDIDFLGGAPLPHGLVAVFWFARSLFSRSSGIFLLASGIAASALSASDQRSDWLGLALGLLVGVAFLVTAAGLVWVLGLLRYYPQPRLVEPLGYLLATASVALLLIFPWPHQLFWPAGLAANLVAGNLGSAGAIAISALGLVVTALVCVVGVYLVARGSLLAPAFEEARTGKQLARQASRASATRVETLPTAALVAQSTTPLPANLPSYARPVAVRQGRPGSALVTKYWIRLQRLPFPEQAYRGLAPMALGAAMAATLALLARTPSRFEVLGPLTYFFNLGLIRVGALPLRDDLEHIDFFAGWPTTRARLLMYDLGIGFSVPLASGVVAFAVAALVGVTDVPATTMLTWLLLWPLLTIASGAVTLVEFQRLLRKWPATTASVPDIGPWVGLVAGLVWLAAIFWGPALGLAITAGAVLLLFLISQLIG